MLSKQNLRNPLVPEWTLVQLNFSLTLEPEEKGVDIIYVSSGKEFLEYLEKQKANDNICFQFIHQTLSNHPLYTALQFWTKTAM